MPRPPILPLYGLVTLLLSTACGLLTLLLGIALSLKGSSISPLALTAGILDIIGIGWIAYLLAGVTSGGHAQHHRRLPTITLLPSMLLSSIASSLTFASLIWIHIQPSETTGTIFGRKIGTIKDVGYAFWAATTISQSVFVSLCFHHDSEDATTTSTGGNRVSIIRDIMDAFHHVHDPPRDIPPPMLMQCYPNSNTAPIPPIPPHYPRSIGSSHSASTALSGDGAKPSFRSTFHGHSHGIRNITSRSRLIRQRSWAGPSSTAATNRPFTGLSSRQGSIVHDGYPASSRRSSLDQSVLEVDEEDEDMYGPTTPMKTRLETIPGSRANSPAKPLDGPFFAGDEEQQGEADGEGSGAGGEEVLFTTPEERSPNAGEEDVAEELHTQPETNVSVADATSNTASPTTDSTTTNQAQMKLPQPPQQGQHRPQALPPPRLHTSSFTTTTTTTTTTTRSPTNTNLPPPPPLLRTLSLNNSHSHSNPASPDESHIHPLFRTDSPLPPPTASSGTSLTAAALGGQFVGGNSSVVRSLSRDRGRGDIGGMPVGVGQIRRSVSVDRGVGSASSAARESRTVESPGRPVTIVTATSINPQGTATSLTSPAPFPFPISTKPNTNATKITATHAVTRDPTTTTLAIAPPGARILIVETDATEGEVQSHERGGNEMPQQQQQQQQQQQHRPALGELSHNTIPLSTTISTNINTKSISTPSPSEPSIPAMWRDKGKGKAIPSTIYNDHNHEHEGENISRI